MKRPFPSAINFGMVGFLVGGTGCMVATQIAYGFSLDPLGPLLFLFVVAAPIQLLLGFQNRAAERKYAVIEFLANQEYQKTQVSA